MTSTNTKAYGLAQRNALEWTVVVSEVQTRGRGRRGKSWHSPKGGLWFSVVLHPALGLGRICLLQIFAAVAVREAVSAETGEQVLVKWPNDLVLNSKKLGGILVETKIVGDCLRFAVVGIGLNVNQPENDLLPGAISLYTVKERTTNLDSLLARILRSLEFRYADLTDSSKLVSEWWSYCVHRSKKVIVEGPEGTMIGRSEAIDEQGRLMVRTETGSEFWLSEGTLRVLAA